ncbi:hypothetical protein QFC21_003911 [Naganishia friedmannii]|uniref:Uncharacterized protein n=1 Tax=Naganishia friedmannii TaxID=89922 RepID=A0ACC2VLB0_9TREE|nr:hypothetical protein QFC21_003911 [Naganishia friedmannii]
MFFSVSTASRIVGRVPAQCRHVRRIQPFSLSASRLKNFDPPTTKATDNATEPPDVPQQLVGSREEIERKRKAAEEKYAEKLERRPRMKAKDLEELKKRVKAPSTLPKGSARSHSVESFQDPSADRPQQVVTPVAKKARKPVKNEQAAADRSGIKPLSQILNLDIIYAHPHTTQAISLLWQHYHTAHPTLSSTFLSATIPPKTYASMVDLAKRYPNFVIPLPRDPTGENATPSATGEQPAFEMFYLQWLFHPTISMTASSATPEGKRDVSKLPIASVIFTPLAEFKNASEWAQPQLVLTHYPDLHNNQIPLNSQSTSTAADQPQHHPVVLMRGEISPSQAKSSLTSPLPSTHLALTQAQAQLLALALQRFYCSELVPEIGESLEAKRLREERTKSLRDFRERPAEWDWKGLVKLAYAGVV